MIASWPGTIARDRVSRDLVDFSDFLPTLCEASGVPVPPELNIDGRSFLPQLKGEAGNPREWIYCWYSRGGQANKAKIFARNQQYKLLNDGKFLDLTDGYAPRELDVTGLTGEAADAHGLLLGVLKKYEDARPKEPRDSN